MKAARRPCGKACYKTRGEAEAAMRKVPLRPGDAHRAYRCRPCKAWHFTSAVTVMAKRRAGTR